MTQIDFDYNMALWIEVDVEADPDDWMPAVVRDRWQQAGLPAGTEAEPVIVQALSMLAGSLSHQDPPPFMAFLLQPDVADAAVTLVAVRVEYIEQPVTLEEAISQVRLPVEMLEQPAQETVVSTPAGPAARLLQRFRSPQSPGVETVADHIAYVWVLDDAGEPVILYASTVFHDLAESDPDPRVVGGGCDFLIVWWFVGLFRGSGLLWARLSCRVGEGSTVPGVLGLCGRSGSGVSRWGGLAGGEGRS